MLSALVGIFICAALVAVPATSAVLATWAGIVGLVLFGLVCVGLAEGWALVRDDRDR